MQRENEDPILIARSEDNDVAQYVLAELAHLQATTRDISNHVLQRVNLHIAIVSGATAVIVFFGQNAVQSQTSLFLVALLLGAILSLGLLIYAEMVQWVITNIDINRSSSRMKRFFFDHHPNLEKYIGPGVPHDDRPIYLRRRGFRAIISTDLGSKQIVTLLNNFTGAIMGACVVLGIASTAYWAAIFAGIIMFAGVWALQFIYARIRYQLSEQGAKKHIRFPRPTSEEAKTSNP